MKKYMLLAGWLAFAALCLAQSKRDYTWMLGHGNQFNGVMFLHFSEDSVMQEEKVLPYGTVHAIANDENGNLLFYYNFCKVLNKDHQIMDNGDNMNPGSWGAADECVKYDDHVGVRSGSLLLPLPNSLNRYFLLHESNIEPAVWPPTGLAIFNLLRLTTIDMSANNGLGRVELRNQPVIADSLHDAIAAVRHGNGRDWWIMVPRGLGREFWQFRLTPWGLTAPELITFPAPPSSDPVYEYARESWGAQARFSPDGTKYLRYSRGNGAEIYDFNRCTGEMVFRRMLPEPPLPAPNTEYPVPAGGICVSPNSRYLYFNNTQLLFQFDLCEENLSNPQSQPILIDHWVSDPPNLGGNTFFLMRNAPDGKIYMNSTNGVKSLHAILKPDLPGKACDFRQAYLKLPKHNSWIWADFPNFNLFDVPGSTCDSLGIDDPNPPKPVPKLTEFEVFPNPASNSVHLFIPHCDGASVSVWNIAGQKMTDIPFVPGMTDFEFSTESWAAGVYLVVLRPEGESPVVRKLVIAR